MSASAGFVLFVDDDTTLRAANVQAMELAGLEVRAAHDAPSALRAIAADSPAVVVTDVQMPGMDGLELFRRVREIDPDLPVVLITGHGDISMAVAAMHEGAYDFLSKPYATEHMIRIVRRAADTRRLVLENRSLRAEVAAAEADGPLIGVAPVMERLRDTIRHVAAAEVDVLVEGETGAGKEVVARLLHRLSHRRGRSFTPISCSALPESVIESELFGHEMGAFPGAVRKRVGRIEAADKGTLFFDEIESLPLETQGKLLRVLEERAVTPLGANDVRSLDFRVIAASKVDLAEEVKRGAFRADLFYRLGVVRIHVPPLRERRADIPIIFGHFLAAAAARLRREQPPLTDAIRRKLLEHDWPGNVRELENFATGVVLGIDGQPGSAGSDAAVQSLPERIEAYEGALIREALASHAGDVRSTLETLLIPRKTFYDKLQRHHISIDHYRPARDVGPSAKPVR
ncbi:MAG: sigma-54-dependent Fis family transcriptional regulator [Phenylobacterium sp.]|nr:sigma-54-dependent Fis family transcriptional regulator [Phenylobacterium sp.]